MEQAPRGTLVGTDYNGNRYYENNDIMYSEYRCVLGTAVRLLLRHWDAQ